MKNWVKHRIQRNNEEKVLRKVRRGEKLNFFERRELSRMKKERWERTKNFIGGLVPKISRKTNFEKQVEQANKLKERAEQSKVTKAQEKAGEEQKTRSSIIKKVNAKLSPSFVKKVREKGNLLADAIEKNRFLTPTKKKIYLTILDFTVASIVEDAKSLKQYEKELIEKKYPPEYVERGVNWFIELTK